MIRRAVIVVAAVLLAPVALLVAEALVARRGDRLPEPEVATLSRVDDSGPTARPLRVVWLGDSTAAAVGTTEPRFAVSSRVSRALSQDCGVSVDTTVVAHSGDQIGDLLRDQLPKVGSLEPDVVFVSVGANDTVHLASASKFRSSYDKLVDGIIAAGVAPSRIVLLGVPDMGSPTRLAQPLRSVVGFRSRQLDRQVKALADARGATYVDIFRGTSAVFRADPSRYFAADKYHPSDDGYALWADVITPVVSPLCD